MPLNTTVPQGFWRLTRYSPVIDCPYRDACIGGEGFGNDLCDGAFTGYLCGEVDSTGSFLNDITQDVDTCSQAALAFPLLLTIAVVLGLIYCVSFVVGSKDDLSSLSRATRRADDPADCETGRSSASGSSTPSLPPAPLTAGGSNGIAWLSTFKLLLCYLQIYSSLPSTFHVPFPAHTSSLLTVWSWLSLWSAKAIPWACLGTNVSFALIAELSTSLPVVLALIMLLVCVVYYEALFVLPGHPMDRKDKQRRVLLRFSCALYLMYYVSFSNAMSLSFGSFYCVDVDPTNAIAGEQVVLWNDVTLDCKSSGYYYSTIWAGMVAALYGLIIPGMFFGLVHVFRESAVRYQYQCHDDDLRMAQAHHSLALLFSSYRVGWMLFEVYDLLGLRLFYLGILPVLSIHNHSTQILIGLLVGIGHLWVLQTYSPYQEQRNQRLAVTGTLALLALQLGSLAVHLDSSAGTENLSLDGALVLVLLALPALWVFSTVIMPNRSLASALPPVRTIFLKDVAIARNARTLQRTKSMALSRGKSLRTSDALTRMTSSRDTRDSRDTRETWDSRDSELLEDRDHLRDLPRRQSRRFKREPSRQQSNRSVNRELFESPARAPKRMPSRKESISRPAPPTPTTTPPSPESDASVSSTPSSPREALIRATAQAYKIYGLEEGADQKMLTREAMQRARTERMRPPPLPGMNRAHSVDPRSTRRGKLDPVSLHARPLPLEPLDCEHKADCDELSYSLFPGDEETEEIVIPLSNRRYRYQEQAREDEELEEAMDMEEDAAVLPSPPPPPAQAQAVQAPRASPASQERPTKIYKHVTILGEDESTMEEVWLSERNQQQTI